MTVVVVRRCRSGSGMAASGRRWASHGKDVFEIAEASEPDRRYAPRGWVTMRASGLRVVENFLDMAHFPFVHTDILGTEPHTEVPAYLSEIRRDVDEVWATNCTFFQPQHRRHGKLRRVRAF